MENLNDPIETQIYKERKEVDYDTREFTIEYIVDKYSKDIDTDKNELFVPDYQREFVWDNSRQSKFIESIILGLPIPYIFVAETKKGRLEIVDGSQRIRTLAAFISNTLELENLKKINLINGKKFQDLDLTRQRKIKNTPIRMVVLTENTTDEAKTEMFDRINKGSDLLREMEQRRALLQGNFTNFLYEITKDPTYILCTPQNKFMEKRQERQELALRFFALCDSYSNYPARTGIAKYLDDYMFNANKSFDENKKKELTDKFNEVVAFVNKNFKYKFSKSHNNQVSRMYFEAISVGTYLALKENPKLACSIETTETWLRKNDFKQVISGKYETHTPQRIKERIEFVRNMLLSK